MNSNSSDIINEFNNHYTTNTISILKVLCSYLTPEIGRILPICIKLLEFRFTCICPPQQHNVNKIDISKISDNPSPVINFLNELIPFCSSTELSTITQLISLIQSYSKIREIISTMETLKEMFPEFFTTDNTDFSDIGSILNFASANTSSDASIMDILSNLMGKESYEHGKQTGMDE